MLYNYNGVNVYYQLKGGLSSRPILLLHGWARSGKDFDEIIDFFPEKTFLVIDFPPFGRSNNEPEGWSVYSYAGMVMSLCEHLKIYEVDIIGHSFGGRIALILSAVKRSLVHSCILVDSAGMKPRRSLKFRFRRFKYKMLKKMGRPSLQKGSADYEALSPEMKETFKSIVNTYLEDYARKSTVKTLIVWGLKDNETPLYMAKRLHRLIKKSQLKVLDGGHFSFMDCKLEFVSTVSEFYKEEK